MATIIPFPFAIERRRRVPKNHGASAPPPCIESGNGEDDEGLYRWYIGSKEELVKKGICQPEWFPCQRGWAWERRRRSKPVWTMYKRDDGHWHVFIYTDKLIRP